MKIDIDELLEKRSYMITCDAFKDRQMLQRIMFDWQGLPFPRAFEGMPDRGKCCSIVDNTHCAVMKFAQEKDFPCILVFEDDVFLCNQFKDKLAEAIEALPDDADILQVGYIATPQKYNDGKCEAAGGGKLIKVDVKGFYGAQTMLYFKPAYQKVQERLESNWTTIDSDHYMFSTYAPPFPLTVQFNFSKTFHKESYKFVQNTFLKGRPEKFIQQFDQMYTEPADIIASQCLNWIQKYCGNQLKS